MSPGREAASTRARVLKRQGEFGQLQDGGRWGCEVEGLTQEFMTPGVVNSSENQMEVTVPFSGKVPTGFCTSFQGPRSRPSTQGDLKDPFLPCTVFRTPMFRSSPLWLSHSPAPVCRPQLPWILLSAQLPTC